MRRFVRYSVLRANHDGLGLSTLGDAAPQAEWLILRVRNEYEAVGSDPECHYYSSAVGRIFRITMPLTAYPLLFCVTTQRGRLRVFGGLVRANSFGKVCLHRMALRHPQIDTDRVGTTMKWRRVWDSSGRFVSAAFGCSRFTSHPEYHFDAENQ